MIGMTATPLADIDPKMNSTTLSSNLLHIVPQYFQYRCTACGFSSTRGAKALAFLRGLVHLLGGDEYCGFDVGLARPIPCK